MGEKRRKFGTVLLRIQSKTPIKLELFPAEEWPGVPEATPGTCRIRQNLAWVSSGGERCFMGREAVGAFLVGLLFGKEPQGEAPPTIRRGTRVRVTLRKQTDIPDESMELGTGMTMETCLITTTELAFTTSPVFQGIDGRWRVCVSTWDEPVLWNQVEVLT